MAHWPPYSYAYTYVYYNNYGHSLPQKYATIYARNMTTYIHVGRHSYCDGYCSFFPRLFKKIGDPGNKVMDIARK